MFLGKSNDSAHKTDEITVEVFLAERRCGAFKCLYVVYIIQNVDQLLMGISAYMLTKAIYLNNAMFALVV